MAPLITNQSHSPNSSSKCRMSDCGLKFMQQGGKMNPWTFLMSPEIPARRNRLFFTARTKHLKRLSSSCCTWKCWGGIFLRQEGRWWRCSQKWTDRDWNIIKTRGNWGRDPTGTFGFGDQDKTNIVYHLRSKKITTKPKASITFFHSNLLLHNWSIL